MVGAGKNLTEQFCWDVVDVGHLRSDKLAEVFALGILAKVVCSQQLVAIVVDEINGIVETLDGMYEQHRLADLGLE